MYTRFTHGQLLLISVGAFLLFFFALALGATLAGNQQAAKIALRCTNDGGTWNAAGYCEKNLSVCTPEKNS